MKHLDLFSGIGGAALAVEAVWGGEETEHIFVENDPYCQALLKLRYPNSKIYGDIRTVTADTHWAGNRTPASRINKNGKKKNKGREKFPQLEPSGQNSIDILTGGFPCQPFSQAGKRGGTSDNRFLWPEMLRIIHEFKPRWVVGENVAGLLTIEQGVVFKQILADLEGEGYEVECFVIPAVAVNAPHRRDRVWIVANSKIGDARQSEISGPGREGKITSQDGFGLRDEPSGSNKDASNARQQYGSEGNEQGMETDKTKWATRTTDVERQDKNASDAANKGLERSAGASIKDGSDGCTSESGRDSWNENWVEVATELCGMDDGLPAELDGLKLSKSRHRAERLKGLGNAWVPQVAIEIMQGIKQIENA